MSVTLLREKERRAAATASVGGTHPAPRTHAHSSVQTVARLLTILPPVLLGLVLLGSWYFSTTRGLVPSYELSSPADTWNVLWDGLTSGLFLKMAWATLQESLGGFLLALLVALPLGYSLARWRLFAITVHPYLAAGQAIPAIVLMPFLVLWMGYGMGPILLLDRKSVV